MSSDGLWGWISDFFGGAGQEYMEESKANAAKDQENVKMATADNFKLGGSAADLTDPNAYLDGRIGGKGILSTGEKWGASKVSDQEQANANAFVSANKPGLIGAVQAQQFDLPEYQARAKRKPLATTLMDMIGGGYGQAR